MPDPGLHGGGLHIHKSGGNLNPHFDYSIHPKLKKQRKINIIYYCSSDPGLRESGTGQLGLWSGDEQSPKKLNKIVEPIFNRAIIFDTTQNSWHGIVDPLPEDCLFSRKSLAIYYLQEPAENCDPRTRALFAPREWQCDDKNVIELIKERSSEATYASAYIKK
jgi:Rps23 Pro-64 3,4-dihydroxylase Tpa1-like proline 4-hydroxylase